MDTYGNWCGGYIGGYLNCCDGGPCAACLNDSTVERCAPSDACLKECPAKDPVDMACAIHDTCLRRPSVVANKPQTPCDENSNNYCGCDRKFILDLFEVDLRDVPFQFGKAHSFRANAMSAFQTLDCWTYEVAYISQVCRSSGALHQPARSTPIGFNELVQRKNPWESFVDLTDCWDNRTACNSMCQRTCANNPLKCNQNVAPYHCGQYNLSTMDACFVTSGSDYNNLAWTWPISLVYFGSIIIGSLFGLNLLCSGMIFMVEKLRRRRDGSSKVGA